MEEYLPVYSSPDVQPQFDDFCDWQTLDALLLDEVPLSQTTVTQEPQAPSKKRKKRANKISKPQNAWVIYRNEFQENLKAQGCEVKDVAQVSSMASAAYSKLTKEQRDNYFRLAEIETDQHKLKHPGVKLIRRTKSKHAEKERQREESVVLEEEVLSEINKTSRALLHRVSIKEDLDGNQRPFLPQHIRMVDSCQVDPSKLRPRLFPRSYSPPETDYSENPFSCFAHEPPPNFERSYSLI